MTWDELFRAASLKIEYPGRHVPWLRQWADQHDRRGYSPLGSFFWRYIDTANPDCPGCQANRHGELDLFAMLVFHPERKEVMNRILEMIL